MAVHQSEDAAGFCARIGKTVGDFDVVELNEAFASQALAVLRQLGLPDDAEHVNPNGGAIALGHPLGMSGARLVGTALMELERRKRKLGLATMCVGVGQGAALALGRYPLGERQLDRSQHHLLVVMQDQGMGQSSMEITRSPGSVLGENQQSQGIDGGGRALSQHAGRIGRRAFAIRQPARTVLVCIARPAPVCLLCPAARKRALQ